MTSVCSLWAKGAKDDDSDNILSEIDSMVLNLEPEKLIKRRKDRENNFS